MQNKSGCEIFSIIGPDILVSDFSHTMPNFSTITGHLRGKVKFLQKEHENAKLPLLPSLKKWPSAIAENTVQNLFQVSLR